MNVLYVYLGDGLREDAKGLLFPFHLSFPSAFFFFFFFTCERSHGPTCKHLRWSNINIQAFIH